MGCEITLHKYSPQKRFRGPEKTLHNEKILRKKANTILEFSELVLNSNQFKFLGQHYLQTSGTAMGTKMAPSYANLFMGVLEKQMLSSY